MVQHRIREELRGVLIFVGAVWVVFVVGRLLPFVNLNDYGLVPRSLTGLVGIFSMPFLHADWPHLLSNTVPLTVLLMLLAGSRGRTPLIVLAIVLLGGGLLWIFGRVAVHVGASGLIYGLIAFLLVSGLLERRFVPLMISLLVGFLYGGTLLAGVVPELGSRVSWEGHLLGAIAGGVVAVGMTRKGREVEEVGK